MRLARNLNFGSATPLYAELLQARGAAIKIDASNVESLGALCVQILVAAAAAWRRDGQDFSFTDPSPAFTDALRLLGARELLCGKEST